MFQCIGKRFNGRVLVACTNTSKTPSTNPVTGRPSNSFLCSECANSRSQKQQLVTNLPDLDKPNYETEDVEGDGYSLLEEIDNDDFGDLQEIDL